MGGYQVTGQGTGDDGFDEEGYDESQRAEILEATRDGPTDGVILTNLKPDLGDDPENDDIEMDGDDVGEEDDSVEEDEDDASEDQVQANFDDDDDDDDDEDLSDADVEALKP